MDRRIENIDDYQAQTFFTDKVWSWLREGLCSESCRYGDNYQVSVVHY
jgi:hypothetical protein